MNRTNRTIVKIVNIKHKERFINLIHKKQLQSAKRPHK
jgi:hypothetical protein